MGWCVRCLPKFTNSGAGECANSRASLSNTADEAGKLRVLRALLLGA